MSVYVCDVYTYTIVSIWFGSFLPVFFGTVLISFITFSFLVFSTFDSDGILQALLLSIRGSAAPRITRRVSADSL